MLHAPRSRIYKHMTHLDVSHYVLTSISVSDSIRMYSGFRSSSMSVFTAAQKQRYRVTLDFNVFSDFDPHQIDLEKVFEIHGDENVDVTIEDLTKDNIW